MIPPAPAITPPWLPCTAPLPPSPVPIPLLLSRRRAPQQRVRPMVVVKLDAETRVSHRRCQASVHRRDAAAVWGCQCCRG